MPELPGQNGKLGRDGRERLKREKQTNKQTKPRRSMIYVYMNDFVRFNLCFSSSPLRTYSSPGENRPLVFAV